MAAKNKAPTNLALLRSWSAVILITAPKSIPSVSWWFASARQMIGLRNTALCRETAQGEPLLYYFFTLQVENKAKEFEGRAKRRDVRGLLRFEEVVALRSSCRD